MLTAKIYLYIYLTGRTQIYAYADRFNTLKDIRSGKKSTFIYRTYVFIIPLFCPIVK